MFREAMIKETGIAKGLLGGNGILPRPAQAKPDTGTGERDSLENCQLTILLFKDRGT